MGQACIHPLGRDKVYTIESPEERKRQQDSIREQREAVIEEPAAKMAAKSLKKKRDEQLPSANSASAPTIPGIRSEPKYHVLCRHISMRPSGPPGQLQGFQNFDVCKILSIAKVTEEGGAETKYRQIELETAHSCHPGDYVFVRPVNSAKSVERMAKVLGIDTEMLDSYFKLVVISENQTVANAPAIEDLVTKFRFALPRTLRQVFSEEIDLSGPPTMRLLKAIGLEIGLPKELEGCTESRALYEQWVRECRPNLITLMETLGVGKVPTLECILMCASLIQPRCYLVTSASSNTGSVYFCYRDCLLSPTRSGLCSRHLRRKKVGDTLAVNIAKGQAISLPLFPDTPLVMVACNVGIAPFKGLLDAAKLSANLTGPLYLLYEFTSAEKAPYFQTISAFEEQGFIQDMLLTSSLGVDVSYEGLALREKLLCSEKWKRLVGQLIKLHNGHLFLCGSEFFCNNMHNALKELFEKDVKGSRWFHEERINPLLTHVSPMNVSLSDEEQVLVSSGEYYCADRKYAIVPIDNNPVNPVIPSSISATTTSAIHNAEPLSSKVDEEHQAAADALLQLVFPLSRENKIEGTCVVGNPPSPPPSPDNVSIANADELQRSYDASTPSPLRPSGLYHASIGDDQCLSAAPQLLEDDAAFASNEDLTRIPCGTLEFSGVQYCELPNIIANEREDDTETFEMQLHDATDSLNLQMGPGLVPEARCIQRRATVSGGLSYSTLACGILGYNEGLVYQLNNLPEAGEKQKKPKLANMRSTSVSSSIVLEESTPPGTPIIIPKTKLGPKRHPAFTFENLSRARSFDTGMSPPASEQPHVAGIYRAKPVHIGTEADLSHKEMVPESISPSKGPTPKLPLPPMPRKPPIPPRRFNSPEHGHQLSPLALSSADNNSSRFSSVVTSPATFHQHHDEQQITPSSPNADSFNNSPVLFSLPAASPPHSPPLQSAVRKGFTDIDSYENVLYYENVSPQNLHSLTDRKVPSNTVEETRLIPVKQVSGTLEWVTASGTTTLFSPPYYQNVSPFELEPLTAPTDNLLLKPDSGASKLVWHESVQMPLQSYENILTENLVPTTLEYADNRNVPLLKREAQVNGHLYRYVELPTLLGQEDFIAVPCPEDEELQRLINKYSSDSAFHSGDSSDNIHSTGLVSEFQQQSMVSGLQRELKDDVFPRLENVDDLIFPRPEPLEHRCYNDDEVVDMFSESLAFEATWDGIREAECELDDEFRYLTRLQESNDVHPAVTRGPVSVLKVESDREHTVLINSDDTFKNDTQKTMLSRTKIQLVEQDHASGIQEANKENQATMKQKDIANNEFSPTVGIVSMAVPQTFGFIEHTPGHHHEFLRKCSDAPVPVVSARSSSLFGYTPVHVLAPELQLGGLLPCIKPSSLLLEAQASGVLPDVIKPDLITGCQSGYNQVSDADPEGRHLVPSVHTLDYEVQASGYLEDVIDTGCDRSTPVSVVTPGLCISAQRSLSVQKQLAEQRRNSGTEIRRSSADQMTNADSNDDYLAQSILVLKPDAQCGAPLQRYSTSASSFRPLRENGITSSCLPVGVQKLALQPQLSGALFDAASQSNDPYEFLEISPRVTVISCSNYTNLPVHHVQLQKQVSGFLSNSMPRLSNEGSTESSAIMETPVYSNDTFVQILQPVPQASGALLTVDNDLVKTSYLQAEMPKMTNSIPQSLLKLEPQATSTYHYEDVIATTCPLQFQAQLVGEVPVLLVSITLTPDKQVSGHLPEAPLPVLRLAPQASGALQQLQPVIAQLGIDDSLTTAPSDSCTTSVYNYEHQSMRFLSPVKQVSGTLLESDVVSQHYPKDMLFDIVIHSLPNNAHQKTIDSTEPIDKWITVPVRSSTKQYDADSPPIAAFTVDEKSIPIFDVQIRQADYSGNYHQVIHSGGTSTWVNWVPRELGVHPLDREPINGPFSHQLGLPTLFASYSLDEEDDIAVGHEGMEPYSYRSMIESSPWNSRDPRLMSVSDCKVGDHENWPRTSILHSDVQVQTDIFPNAEPKCSGHDNVESSYAEISRYMPSRCSPVQGMPDLVNSKISVGDNSELYTGKSKACTSKIHIVTDPMELYSNRQQTSAYPNYLPRHSHSKVFLEGTSESMPSSSRFYVEDPRYPQSQEDIERYHYSQYQQQYSSGFNEERYFRDSFSPISTISDGKQFASISESSSPDSGRETLAAPFSPGASRDQLIDQQYSHTPHFCGSRSQVHHLIRTQDDDDDDDDVNFDNIRIEGAPIDEIVRMLQLSGVAVEVVGCGCGIPLHPYYPDPQQTESQYKIVPNLINLLLFTEMQSHKRMVK